jgi:drug/metabolite transporter (DMT)-like permease
MEDVWLLLALVATLLYGISQVAQKMAMKEIPSSTVVSLSIVVATPIAVICLVPYLVTGDILDVEPMTMVLALASATFGQIGYYLYLEAAGRGPISIVGSVTASYPIMVIVVAVLFLSETPSYLQLGGVLLVTTAMIVLSYSHGKEAQTNSYFGKYLPLCLVTVLLYGLWAIFTKLALDEMPPLLFIGVYAFVIPPTVLWYYHYKGIKLRQALPSWSVPFTIAVIASEVSNIAFFFEINAADQGPASIVFPVVAASPVVVVLMAYGFLKERLSRNEILLVVAVIAGIVMASTV